MKLTTPLSLLLAAILAAAPACAAEADPAPADITTISLSDAQITVDGAPASADPDAAVYVGADIVYYHDGTDETYGEGTDSEKHSAEAAAAHTVVTITQPGTYRLTGTLSKGQVTVDLGKEAKDDPAAVVTLILDNANVTCTVAPALIFYNVYECDRDFVSYDNDENPDYQASATVDTSAAGANVILAKGSVNTFTGSHVARIYKEGTTKKLHKYDGAFYSKMSMNIFGDNGDDSGLLNIVADNEGLDSELHLTLNGGSIHITAQNDGINTNEDYVSVTTVNGGSLTIDSGLGAEGDGIDSNGYLVINGGNVFTAASDHSPDGGIDAEMPILINGGTVSAFGVRNDNADSASAQPYMELSFAKTVPAGSLLELKDGGGNVVWAATTQKSCQSVTLSNSDLQLGTIYHLYVDGVQQSYTGHSFGMGGFGGGQPPEGFDPSQIGERPADMPQPPEGFDPAQMGQRPEGAPERPEGDGQRPGGRFPGRGQTDANAEPSADFILTADQRSFSGIQATQTVSPFADVDETSPSFSAICTLFQKGIIQGDGAGHFYPGDLIQEAHWQLILERLAQEGVRLDDPPSADGLTRAAAAELAAQLLSTR